MNIIAEALDALALALSQHDHTWTAEERQLYECAVATACGDCTETDWWASETRQLH